MKKYIILICSIVVAIGMTTCLDEGMDFDTNGGKGKSFVRFVGGNRTLAAKAGANTTVITVSSTFKSEAARTYNLVVTSKGAVEGTHYSLSSKTVTIPAGQYAGSVTLTANLANLTPATVAVDISINSDEAIDYGKNITVSMYLFFEVTMDWLVGNWLWADTFKGEPDEPYIVEIKKINDNTISITNIWGAGMTVEATVDYANARINIKPDQVIHVYGPPSNYGNVYMNSRAGGNLSRTAPIPGICSYNGTISIGEWGAFVHDFQANAGWFDFTSLLTKM